ncbi:MAG: hypothetical protein WC829_09855 [Hyphomicrobium sp.]|jgi:hypothetical protein
MSDHEPRYTYNADDHGTRIALLEQSTYDIKSQLKAINSNISRLVWLLVTALGFAVMKFVIGGGLA